MQRTIRGEASTARRSVAHFVIAAFAGCAVLALVGLPTMRGVHAESVAQARELRAIQHLKRLHAAQDAYASTNHRCGDLHDLAPLLHEAWQSGSATRVELAGYVVDLRLIGPAHSCRWVAHAWPADARPELHTFMITELGAIESSSVFPAK